ncbi:hypothetical protein [Laspinema palackyanum]|uniref:hypothetical protein n=1 Tax=Laspinema palackyanum TaxID=3231601 RepID=UPI00345CAD37|nr:hypothetical protein [Laspinema sp. D2c]
MKRNRKGLIGIESDRGYLRLRFPPQFFKRYLYLNLPDSPQNRAIAQKLAEEKNQEIQQAQIESLNF